MRSWSLAFIGKRKIGKPELVYKSIHQALAALQQQAIEAGDTLTLICNPAAGADLLALDAASELGIERRIVLPMPIDAFQATFVGYEAEWPRAEAHIQTSSSELSEGSHVEPQCYRDAADELLEGADFLIAVWDGQAAEGKGGTEESIRKARAQGLPIRIYDNCDGHCREGETVFLPL